MKLIFASSNKNKIEEIKALLPNGIELLSLSEIDCNDEIPETANTIEGNAVLKANYISQKFGYNCFADDSGLEVDALQGEPGVFSARYAGEPKNDENNIQKLLKKLSNSTNRKANFKTVICLNINGKQHLFTGIVEGTIINEKKGTNGFGYDPIFVAKGQHQTFAELTLKEKSALSHRAIAFKQMTEFLKEIH